MWVSEDKKRYFEQGGQAWLKHNAEWKREFELCNCQTCYDMECKARNKKTRFPEDAGGECQCLPLAQDKSKFAFRNVDGAVVILPENIVSNILAYSGKT